MKPKKLNLEKMWKVYLLLRPAIESRKQEELLADEILKIVELSRPQALLECIHVMYDNNIEFSEMDEFIVLFSNSIIRNGFFEFVYFVKELFSGNSNQ